MIYDVVIIGAGVIGAFAARSLSRYQVSVCLLEKGNDVATGASKANSGIVHAGYDAIPGTLKARLNVQGSLAMGRVCKELDVHFKRIGSLVLAFSDEDRAKLGMLMERGLKNGVEGMQMLDAAQLRLVAPNVSGDAVSALHAETAGIVCPYELTFAAVENAVVNGVELRRGCEVKGIAVEGDGFRVLTGCGEISCRFIVNAAGVHADIIAAMIGDRSFSIRPRKGEYMLFDKSQGSMVDKVVFQTPTELGKGILVTPTVDGNLLVGPNAEDIDDRSDVSTTAGGLEQILHGALRSVPGIDPREVISSFAGIRAGTTGADFIIKTSASHPHFINAAGIDSPGLTAAPAAGEYIAGLLGEAGLRLEEKAGFSPERRPAVRVRELSPEELGEAIKRDPAYGRLVCRCERVSEGEVVDCIRRPAGAGDLDAVKRRTRAGMGRCQGGFCLPRIAGILARELGIPEPEVTKAGGAARIMYERWEGRV